MPRTIAVHSAEIGVWRPIIERALRGEGEWISPATLERAKRFLHVEDAHRCIGAELLRNRVLQREAGLDPTRLRVTRDEYGKPYLPDVPYLHFNISHSGEMILCAVDRYPVGVDVELVRAFDPDVAEVCFTPRERERLTTCGPDEARYEFGRLWTLKESYLKALGTGLSRDPLSVEIVPIDSDELLWRADDEMTLRVLTVPDMYVGGKAGSYVAAVCGKGEYRVRECVSEGVRE